MSQRGRPRELNIDKALGDLYDAMSTAVPTLADIRKSSKGYRSDAVLGTSTTAPDWALEAEDLLRGALHGRDLNVQEISQIKDTIKDLRQLGSPYGKVRARGREALTERIEQEYFESLDKLTQNEEDKRKRVHRIVRKIKRTFKKMTSTQKAEFFGSKYYQKPEKNEEYKHIQEWANEDSGRKLTMQEAWIYLYERRFADGLSVDFLE